jgi:secreted trypsin-like serine protease
VAANWLALSGAHDLLDLESQRIAHPISKVIIHEGFDLNTFDNDIALLKLSQPVSWNRVRSPICLPPQDYEIPGGTQCVITGWGVASRNLLKHPNYF